METKFLYTCQINCLWIKGCWYLMITDTSRHILYLEHFYAGYQIMVFDQSQFSIFTIKPEMKLYNLYGEQFSWNPLPKLSGWTFISKLLCFSLTWKQIIWKLCWGNGRSAGSETIFSVQLLHASLHKGYTDFLKTSLSLYANYPFLQVTQYENIEQSWNSHLHNALFLGNIYILFMLLIFFKFNLAHVKPKELQN